MDREVGRFSPAALALAVGSLLGYPTAPASAQPRYSVVELQGVAQQINNSGQVAGWIFVGSAAHAAIYSNGSWRDLGVPAGEQLSVLNGINDAGAAVGFSFVSLPPPANSTDPDNRWQAVLAPAGATAVGPLAAIAPDSFAYAINDAGAIVGCLDNYLDLFPDPHRAFVYANGTLTELHGLLTPQPDSDFTCARDVNASGAVVGEIDASGFRRGFLYRNGVATRLDQGQRFMTMARAINGAGRIAGDGQLPGFSAEHALTYDVATASFASLGVEATGAFASQGNDINARGDVVGTMQLNVGEHAFLASGGRVYDLNDLIPAGTGWVLQDALSVNDRGQIVGRGVLASSPDVVRYFLLDASAPLPSIAGLIAQVKALEAAGQLSHGQATALIAHLQCAERHVRAGRCLLAAASLELFGRSVDLLIRTRRLPAALGQPLIDQADRIIDDLLAPSADCRSCHG
jgi:probable HAF family extracellular repeat protein